MRLADRRPSPGAGPTRIARDGVLAAALLLLPIACHAQQRDSAAMVMDSASAETAAANEAMAEMRMNPHMRMTDRRPAAPGDSARAAQLVATMRAELVKYQDVHAALADGYRIFLPKVPQPIYHFTSFTRAVAARFTFDPAKPTSLLYRHNRDSSYTLVGAMYTAPASASLDELDARIPLSVARWHEHVNWCLPPAGQRRRWTETRNGTPVFGPKSPIATEAACDSVGGRFFPRIFNWMIHVNAFAGDDPAVIFADPDQH